MSNINKEREMILAQVENLLATTENQQVKVILNNVKNFFRKEQKQ